MDEEIADFSEHFQHGDLENKDEMPINEYIALVRSKAQKYESQIAEAEDFEDEAMAIAGVNLDMFVQSLGKTEARHSQELTCQKNEAIVYIKELRDSIVQKRNERRIEKQFREQLKNGQIKTFSDLEVLSKLLYSHLSRAEYAALLQETADKLVEQFKTECDLAEMEACHEMLIRYLMLKRIEDTDAFQPYEVECQSHISKLLHITPS